MDISIWAKTSGTWVNAASVLVGTLVGLGLRRNFSAAMQQTLQHGVGLMSVVLGVGLAALGLGGVLGEWLQIDDRLARFGMRASAWSGRADSGIEGMVAAFLLF